jgi:hypothetical protein
MSEGRAITNHIGNCIAVVVMASWEKELDWDRFHAILGRPEKSVPVSEVPVLANEMGRRFLDSNKSGGQKPPLFRGSAPVDQSAAKASRAMRGKKRVA